MEFDTMNNTSISEEDLMKKVVEKTFFSHPSDGPMIFYQAYTGEIDENLLFFFSTFLVSNKEHKYDISFYNQKVLQLKEFTLSFKSYVQFIVKIVNVCSEYIYKFKATILLDSYLSFSRRRTISIDFIEENKAQIFADHSSIHLDIIYKGKSIYSESLRTDAQELKGLDNNLKTLFSAL